MQACVFACIFFCCLPRRRIYNCLDTPRPTSDPSIMNHGVVAVIVSQILRNLRHSSRCVSRTGCSNTIVVLLFCTLTL